MPDRVRRAARAAPARLLVLALLVLAGLGVAAPPAAGADPVVETAYTVRGTPEADGTPVDLDVTLITTDPAVARPAVVLAHGFGGTKDDSAAVGRRLARSGYAVLTFTARGFGASGGLIHLDDPAFEGADAVRLVDFAAARPEVLSRDGDPVIGFAGASYGGAVSLLASALDPRIDAVAPAFTWNSLVTALFPQNLVAGGPASLADVPATDAGVFKERWASLFFLGGGGGGGGDDGSRGGGASRGEGEAEPALCGRFTAALCRGYLRTAESGRPDPDLVELLARSGPDRLLSRVTAPTLLLQGEQDTLFGLDQADANLRGLPAATPARMEWVPGGHDAQVAIDDQLAPIEAWFARYLRQDGSAPDSTFTVAVPQAALVGDGDDDQDEVRVLRLPAYPGRGGALTSQELQISGPPQTLVAPPGGTPAALTNLPGTGAALARAASVGGYALGVLPGQAAVFTSEPLAEPLDLVGSGRVELQVTSSTDTATLFVSVWDVGPDAAPTGAGRSSSTAPVPSSAVLPGLAVAPVRLTRLIPGRPSPVTVALPAVAHAVPVGHRLRLVVASTDQAYALPRSSAVYTVALGANAGATTGGLVLPRLEARIESGGALRVPLALLLVVAGLALAASVAATVAWLRRRSRAARTDLRDVPLAVDGLVKTYGDGFRAVDGVSFTAGPGQVVGLLGPNGAGKTTTLRMLVGLIRPDSGAVFVAGRPVEPGAEVLGTVGALIEGPGFLPHLTGRQNLAAYWQATGRPAEEAQLEEALEVAGLGSALDRRVRGYSQGMRQRLGIAQAMLGRPDLLLLDEPTNGLDPPQILAMRTVLAEYAATGRTVLVSSHLLSEVEQTCSHVVVMNRGRVVLTGSVAELTAADDVTLVGLAPGARREEAEAALTRLGLAVDQQDGLLRITGSRPRSELVAALVAAGVGVESVDGRRQLEEVFMGLVGAPPPDERDGAPVRNGAGTGQGGSAR